MEIADWKKLFAPHILSRGEEYYESELVEIKAMDGCFMFFATFVLCFSSLIVVDNSLLHRKSQASLVEYDKNLH